MSTSTAQARFLRLLLGAIGATTACSGALAASGCGGKVVVDLATNGVGGSGGSGGSGGGMTTTSTSTSSTSTSGNPIDCKSHLVSSDQPSPDNTCAAGDPSVYAVNVNCFSAPPAPATCADYTEGCILSTYGCGFSSNGWYIACGPMPGPSGECCYVIPGDCAVGRPFTVDGHARLGVLVPGAGWHTALAPDLRGVDEATRAALADAWGQEALFEHASIASFARYLLQLLALGAPADLVAQAQRALADEHEHARTCLGLASAYAGRALQPGALDIAGALAASMDPAAIAASLASEGCVAETVAALLVQRAHDEARDPVVKEALGRIAEQESAHAVLAWQALAWMIERGGAPVRAAVAAVFAAAEEHASLGAVTDRGGDAEVMRAHGYLPVEERRALAREALGRVVGPAATALLVGGGGVAMGRDEGVAALA